VYVAHIYPEHGGQSTWDSWFGNAANSVPFFITEWGWQQGGATPTSGTLSGYGVPFSTYMESKGLSWTAWVFDQFWQPVMFDQSYNLLGGENFMGQYTKDFLFQHRNDNLPGGSGPTSTPTRTNTPGGPTNTPTRTNTPVSGGNLKVQLRLNGSDNTQRSDFYYRVTNTGASAQSNISVRVYFTLENHPALERLEQQSQRCERLVAYRRDSAGSLYRLADNPRLCERFSCLGQRSGRHARPNSDSDSYQHSVLRDQHTDPHQYPQWADQYANPYQHAPQCIVYAHSHQYTQWPNYNPGPISSRRHECG